MRILVITPPGGPRSANLFAQLEASGGRRVDRCEAVMLVAFPDDFDRRRAAAVNNRDLTPAEIGCAASHRAIWDLVAGGDEPWACVFEDDAVVVDQAALEQMLGRVSQLDPGSTGTVVSLFSRDAVAGSLRDDGMVEVRSEPAYAVAYCISREAARRLAAANAHGSFIADWPRGSGVRFLLADHGFIEHGTSTTSSVIGESRRAQPIARELSPSNLSPRIIANRIGLYAFVGYLRNRQYFAGPREYYQLVIRHRLVHHLGKVLGRRDPRLPPGVRRVALPGRSHRGVGGPPR